MIFVYVANSKFSLNIDGLINKIRAIFNTRTSGEDYLPVPYSPSLTSIIRTFGSSNDKND